MPDSPPGGGSEGDMIMHGSMVKLGAVAASLSGGTLALETMLVPDAQSLKGLGPEALLALITLCALGVLTYGLIKGFAAINKLTEELTKSNDRTLELCAKMNVRPCLKGRDK
jgi:fructose-specific phosphotransferase system IIC component